MALDYFTLLSCTPDVPYHYNDVVSIYPPTLDDIRRISYNTYQSYTNMLAADKYDLAEMLGIDGNEIDGDTLKFVTVLPFFREAYMASLSFFIRQNVLYDEDSGYSLEDGTFLSMDDIRKLRKLILQFAYIEDKSDSSALKFKNAKAKKIYEKIQALKAARKDFSDMMNNVNRILRLVITGEVEEDDFSATVSCGGNCANCSGCS